MVHLVPDEPGWIDLRGPLLSGRCRIFAGPDTARGFVLRSTDFPFACIWGEPPRQALHRAVQGAVRNPEFRILVEPDRVTRVADELPAWRRADDALIHRWSGEETELTPLPEGISVERIERDSALLGEAGHVGGSGDARRVADLLARVPDDLRPEIELALRRACPMTVAWAMEDGRRLPVSFCYAPWITETLWDVSVDTLEAYRRRGLAAALFEALRLYLAPEGLTPVWGAMEGNAASRRLAAKLGFEETTRRATFAPPRM